MSSLLANGIATLDNLEANPLVLVSGIFKAPFNGRYLPTSILGALISAKQYLSLERVYLGIPPIKGLSRTVLERYLSSWKSAKQKGLLTSEDKITFDGSSESWPIFSIELTDFLIKYGLWEILSFASQDSLALPELLYFQSIWLGGVLNMAVNNSPLRWPMHKGVNDGVGLWLWIRIKYERLAKLDPLTIFYADKIRSLKLRSNGSLRDYIDWFQGLAIIWREIYPLVQPEHKLVNKKFEQIEDPPFTGPCESIKNWHQLKKTFCDAVEIMSANKIGNNVGQNKKYIDMEVNSLLMGSGSNKSRATG